MITGRLLRSLAQCLPLLLLACAGPLPRPADSTPPAVAAPPLVAPAASPARKPALMQKRGGAYYKDDGPGDEIPDNLDQLPDAQPRPETLHRFANKPYVVLGKLYVPQSEVRPFRQRGVASWYGKKFHGQKTSIGEPYDMFAMTAAHPTLAIPSYVRVTSLQNGNSVIVRVTDRGPFHADRIIDLSYAAAYRLGYVDNGSAVVDVEALLADESSFGQSRPPSAPGRAIAQAEVDEIAALAAKLAMHDDPPPAPPRSPNQGLALPVFVQLGAFSNADNAESLRSHLSRELDWLGESIQLASGGGLFRVQIGPFARRSEAEKVAERIRSLLGYKPALVNR